VTATTTTGAAAPASAAAGRVARVAAAPPSDAEAYFARRLRYETDCSDVHHDQALGGDAAAAFVVVDARSPEAFAAGHLPGAVSLPHGDIDARTTAAFAPERLVVTYCWGPHCNAATQAAAKFAALGFAVKEMLGGYDAWCHEGYRVERGAPVEPDDGPVAPAGPVEDGQPGQRAPNHRG
jgi:rhodanese-related sulfurtransferase